MAKRKGEFFALFAYLFWGFLPVYWKHLAVMPPTEIVAHRFLWCAVGMVILSVILRHSTFLNRWIGLRDHIPYAWDIRSNRRTKILIVLATAIILSNCYLFIWAVNSADILEVSLSNFIAPIVHIVLGKLILKEKLSYPQLLAVALATAGVLFLSFECNHIPWIALCLALGFGVYSYLRKISPLNAIQGFTLETLLLTPFALAYLGYQASQGQGHFNFDHPELIGLLLLAGPITLIPLLSFTQGARLLNLSTLGFFQFLLPTIQFILAVFVYQEPITLAYGIGFGLIFFALLIYVLSTYLNPPSADRAGALDFS